MSLKQRSSFVLFMHRFVPVLTVLLAVFSILAINLRTIPVAEAATNSTINFQARLQSASGAIVADGNYNIEFKLYGASSGGTALWTEDHYNTASNGLRTVNGYFSAKLGSVTAFPSTINWDQELWLTMNVGGTTTGSPTLDGEMNPRLKLTAVPYAISAGQLQTTNGSYTSKLGIQAPTGGNQVFQIQDQGAAGTYNILTAPNGSDGYIKLQGTTPGTAQTGSLNISGTGMFGILQSATIDAGSGDALAIGGTNATSINIGHTGVTTYVQDTLNVGTLQVQYVDTGSAAPLYIGTTTANAINIGRSGVKTYFGDNINAEAIETTSVDRTTAGTITFGNANATTINIASNNTAHAINIGTGAAAQTVTIGSTTSSSATTIYAGSGGLNLATASGGIINNSIGGVDVFRLGTSGDATFKTITNGVSSFQVQNASGSSVFIVDTTNSTAGSCASCGLVAGTLGISTTGALTFQGSGSTTFRTPGTNGDGSNGVNLTTKINIPIYDPGAYNQIIAIGLSGSAASTARGILVADARSSAHQATIGVLSPDEAQIGGFSWNGSTGNFTVGSTSSGIIIGNSGGAGLSVTDLSGRQLVELGNSTRDGVLQFNNSTNANNASIQAPSVSTSYITNLPTAIGTAGQCVSVASVASSTQQLGYAGCLTASNGVQLQASTPGSAQTGNLNISGTGIFGTGVSTGTVAASGNVTLTNTSTTAFKIQNAGSTILLNADTSTSTITLGSSASGNYITFTAAGGLQSFGTSQHGKSIVYSPEYTNAVFDAAADSSCSSANNGTLTSAYDATNYRNYYNWTSTQATNQCYDVVLDITLPNDFSSWASSDPINLQALASNASNAGYAVAIRNVTGAAWDGNYGSSYTSPGTITTSWTDVASSAFSGTYNAGDRLSIKIRMTAKSSANLQLGNLTLNYNSKW